MDKLLHKVFSFVENCDFKSLKPFIGRESIFKYYYAENELYILTNTLAKESIEIHFIKAKSPKEAFEILMGKKENERV